jgi:hypothetical protein
MPVDVIFGYMWAHCRSERRRALFNIPAFKGQNFSQCRKFEVLKRASFYVCLTFIQCSIEKTFRQVKDGLNPNLMINLTFEQGCCYELR